MFRKSVCLFVLFSFIFSYFMLPSKVQAAPLLGLPAPGTMVSLSPAYEPALIKGITVHKDNPFLFDFIVDTGHSQLKGDALKQEGDRLIKYFFAALTIPEKDLWVNLSPYEKDRMVPEALGQTAMGRDLLAQDYLLKQITASLIYPEKELGKKFWNKIYAEAQEKFGDSTEFTLSKAEGLTINTFNKVWIVAEKASVYEHNQTAFVVGCHLKVMLEEDYMALSKNSVGAGPCAYPTCPGQPQGVAPTKEIIREIILPAIEQEVNTGKNFATLRQIFYSQILATWFKRNLKQALLSQVYANKSTVHGIDLKDAKDKQNIYERYLQAYKKGVFNFIKEERVIASQKGEAILNQTVPRKYFSGGYSSMQLTITRASKDMAQMAAHPIGQDWALTARLNARGVDAAMINNTQIDAAKADLVQFLKNNINILPNVEEDWIIRLNNLFTAEGIEQFVVDLSDAFTMVEASKLEVQDKETLVEIKLRLRVAIVIINEFRHHRNETDKKLREAEETVELVKRLNQLIAKENENYMQHLEAYFNKTIHWGDIFHALTIPMDDAMMSIEAKGGIDLNVLDEGLSVSKDANGGVQIFVDKAMIEWVQREGIHSATPVIIYMKLLPSVYPLLGLQEPHFS